MDPSSGCSPQQESESSAVNEILGISLPKRSAPVPIPQQPPSSNRFIPPGYEKSNVFTSGDSSHSREPMSERRLSFRDKLKQRVESSTSDNSPTGRSRFFNTNKKAAKGKDHFAKGPDGTAGFHFTRTVSAEPKDLPGSPVPTPKSSPSVTPTGSPTSTPHSALSASSPVFTPLSASPVLRSTSSPARRTSTTQPPPPRPSNSSPSLLPYRSQQQQYGSLPPLELPSQASEQAFFSQFNQPTLNRRSSSSGPYQSSPYLSSQSSHAQPSPPASSAFSSDPYFTAFASSQTQSQQPSSRSSRRYSNEGPLGGGTPVVVIPQIPDESLPKPNGGGGRGGGIETGRVYYPPSLSMVPVPLPLGGGSAGPSQMGPPAPELRRFSSDQSNTRSRGHSSDNDQGDTQSPVQTSRSPPLYKYQKKVTPSQSPGQSPLDPIPLTRTQSAELPKQVESSTTKQGSPVLQYKPIQQGAVSASVPKSYGQPLQQRERAASTEYKKDDSTNNNNSSSNNNTTNNTNNRPPFERPIWKPKAKSDTEKLRAEFEIDKPDDAEQKQKEKGAQEGTKQIEKQRELEEDEKRRERERLRALERRQEIERAESEQRAVQRQKQIEEAAEQSRIAELERQAKQRAAERQRDDLEAVYEKQRQQQEAQAFEKLKEFERQEKEKLKQKELEEQSKNRQEPKNGSETWKKKEFVPTSVEKKTYEPPLARAWPLTVPPQKVPPDQDLWETVPPHISSDWSQVFAPPKQDKSKLGQKFPQSDKKGQDSAWNPKEEDVEKQAALLYFYSDSREPLKPGTDKQVEQIREAMAQSVPKKPEESRVPSKSPTPASSTKKTDSEGVSSVEVVDEPKIKKEIKKFAPFNQKAVDRAAGVKLLPPILESNLQDQRDELMALKSIFDSDFQKEGDAPPTSKPSPSDIYRIKIKPVGAGNSAIELRFSYPPNYPSDGPPAVSVTAEGWLTPYAIQLLHHHLDKLLQESEGQVVVYTLATWMQEESWSYLMSKSSYSNPIVVHFSPLSAPKRSLGRPSGSGTESSSRPSQSQTVMIQPLKYHRGHPFTISEGKLKITVVAFFARIRTLSHVQQLIREIKDKQKEKPTSPKYQGHTEQYLVAYRFAATDRSPVNEGSDGDEFGAGGSSESILRLLQKLNLYDISVVVRLRWATPPGGDVYKKMLTYILTVLKEGGVTGREF